MRESSPPSLENRIIDLLALNSTKVEIGYDRYYKAFTSESSFDKSWAVTIETPTDTFAVGYMKEYYWSPKMLFANKNLMTSQVSLDIEYAEKILSASEENLKSVFTKQLFPISPEIAQMMSNVETIQEWKSQVDYIMAEIQKIRNNQK